MLLLAQSNLVLGHVDETESEARQNNHCLQQNLTLSSHRNCSGQLKTGVKWGVPVWFSLLYSPASWGALLMCLLRALLPLLYFQKSDRFCRYVGRPLPITGGGPRPWRGLSHFHSISPLILSTFSPSMPSVVRLFVYTLPQLLHEQ